MYFDGGVGEIMTVRALTSKEEQTVFCLCVCLSVCLALLYELFYTRVFLSEETELCQAMEACRVGGQRYRHSTPEDQAHRYTH